MTTVAVVIVSLFAFAKSFATAPAAAGGQTGAALYGQKCAGCHGKGGQGMAMWKDKGQPDFTDPGFQRSHSDQQLTESIANGKGKFMPAFKGKLSDDQIASLVAQVRSFGHK